MLHECRELVYRQRGLLANPSGFHTPNILYVPCRHVVVRLCLHETESTQFEVPLPRPATYQDWLTEFRDASKGAQPQLKLTGDREGSVPAGGGCAAVAGVASSRSWLLLGVGVVSALYCLHFNLPGSCALLWYAVPCCAGPWQGSKKAALVASSAGGWISRIFLARGPPYSNTVYYGADRCGLGCDPPGTTLATQLDIHTASVQCYAEVCIKQLHLQTRSVHPAAILPYCVFAMPTGCTRW